VTVIRCDRHVLTCYNLDEVAEWLRYYTGELAWDDGQD